MGRDRIDDRAIEAEVEARRHHDRAQHAHRIFLEALVRIADAADQSVLQVLQPADVVDDRERADVVEERVDREVAAERILFGRAEGVVVLMRLWQRLCIGACATAVARQDVSRAEAGSLSVPAGMFLRNVATSIVLRPKRTWARRKRRPMIQQFLKSFLTW